MSEKLLLGKGSDHLVFQHPESPDHVMKQPHRKCTPQQIDIIKSDITAYQEHFSKWALETTAEEDANHGYTITQKKLPEGSRNLKRSDLIDPQIESLFIDFMSHNHDISTGDPKVGIDLLGCEAIFYNTFALSREIFYSCGLVDSNKAEAHMKKLIETCITLRNQVFQLMEKSRLPICKDFLAPAIESKFPESIIDYWNAEEEPQFSNIKISGTKTPNPRLHLPDTALLHYDYPYLSREGFRSKRIHFYGKNWIQKNFGRNLSGKTI